jgi:hypothetical protein
MSNSLSLYHLSEQYETLFNQLYDHETGEVNQEIEAQVNALLPQLEAKCIAVGNWIKKLESEKREIEFMKDEIQKREEAYSKAVTKWQDYLKTNMEKNNMTKISCPYFTLKIKKNPLSTDIYDEFQLPSKFMRTKEIVKVEMKPDKEAIKAEVLKTGVQVPGAIVAHKTKLEMSISSL